MDRRDSHAEEICDADAEQCLAEPLVEAGAGVLRRRVEQQQEDEEGGEAGRHVPAAAVRRRRAADREDRGGAVDGGRRVGPHERDRGERADRDGGA